MRATLYDALGIPPAASDEAVRAALRRQIRKYYARTRDGHSNVEEALRFINHASRILSDPERRANYDHDLAASSGTVEERIAHVVNTAVAKPQSGLASSRVGPAAAASGGSSGKGSRAAGGESARKPQHPGLTEGVASLRRSTSVAISLCALFVAIIAAAVMLVTPPDVVAVAKQVLMWLTLSLLALTAVYGVVHGFAWRLRGRAGATTPAVPLANPAILNWRREKSVFLGTSQPQEDAGWVFQLRMAEMERAKSGRTSEPHPWNRLAARLFDYAIWGLILAVPLAELQITGVLSSGAAYWLGHPLLAPTVITASWIPVEAVLIASMQTTPGKWLFGVFLQFSISDAYAVHDRRTRFTRAAARGLRVWWRGIGCGFPLLAPIMIAVAYEKVAADQETPWDSAEDCLVTHVPIGHLNTLTGAAGLAAMLWLYGVGWHQTMTESIAWARMSIPGRLSTAPALLRSVILGGTDATREGTAGRPVAPGDARRGLAGVATSAGSAAGNPGVPIDPDVAALWVERRERLAFLSIEGPRILEAGNWAQATEVCGAWANLDLDNAEAWRCLGRALQAQGRHREAVKALRKAKQFDPTDSTIDAAINRSQRGIVADFLSRRGH
jgi:hypothetical protein